MFDISNSRSTVIINNDAYVNTINNPSGRKKLIDLIIYKLFLSV